MDRQTLERRLTVALSNLIVDEWRILTAWAPNVGAGSERAIASKLGWHINVLMERRWDVDCEYNRVGKAFETEVKRWNDAREPVTPDLIVHRRGLRGRENNLLVLELKKNSDGNNSSAQQTSGGSLKSILDIQKTFGYQHAVLLNLQLTAKGPTPRWTWIEFAERRKADHEPDAVYDDPSLSALYERGRTEDGCRYDAAAVLQSPGARSSTG
jgi:hypothetical protein